MLSGFSDYLPEGTIRQDLLPAPSLRERARVRDYGGYGMPWGPSPCDKRLRLSQAAPERSGLRKCQTAAPEPPATPLSHAAAGSADAPDRPSQPAPCSSTTGCSAHQDRERTRRSPYPVKARGAVGRAW